MPQLPSRPTPAQLLQAYDEGYEGWLWNKEIEARWEKFNENKSDLYGASVDPEKLKDLHKTVNRALLWRYRTKVDPTIFMEERQTTGDCVSHGSRNCRDTSSSVEVAKGKKRWYKRGATEPTYGARGHGGEGMDPTAAAEYEHEIGFLYREPYRDTNLNVSVDLSKYNANIGTNWGRSGVPKGVQELCKKHKVGQWIRPKNSNEVADGLAAGGAAHSGQSWGTSSKQPKDGINRKSASWGHDMATVGYDFSREFFKENVFFVENSWEDWNEPNPIWVANQDIYGPWCAGMIVISEDEYDRYFARSGSIHLYFEIEGIPVTELPWIDNTVVL